MLFLQDRNMFRRLLVLLFVASCMVTAVPAGAADEAILPPELPWEGASRALMAPADHAWITPAEVSGLTVGERARALASIAHPDFRDDLLAAAERLG